MSLAKRHWDAAELGSFLAREQAAASPPPPAAGPIPPPPATANGTASG